jgi:2-polyprenyl-3-methyl-5-hydroxy-6-metoxy-1,4-benzoquinol methylase
MKINKNVHSGFSSYELSDAQKRFDSWWGFSERLGLHEPEFLLPLAEIVTTIDNFHFETFPTYAEKQQLEREIAQLAPWAYQIEFPTVGISTLGYRDPKEWLYHRYRASLLIHSIKRLLGNDFQTKTFIDVACHCGPFAIELAALGAKQVTAIDLRPENIRQAEWLSNVFGVRQVKFCVDNARNIGKYCGYDVVFCGGLLYHLTFPTEFVRDIYEICSDFVIFDTMAHSDPFSGFHLVVNRNTEYSAEGETHYELHPTYRGVVDMLLSVGFENVIEIIGTSRNDVPHYQQGVVKSFLAFKNGSESFNKIRSALAPSLAV